jgi:hypothetical protein
METQNGVAKKSRLRSPNYPALNLQKSLELAKKLFDVHGRRPIPLGVAAQDWGVAPTSNYTAQHLAAITAFGLVGIEGSKDERKLTISDLAYNIFIDNRPDSRDRSALIAKAALNPDIFAKLYDKYFEKLPPDHALEYELVKEHKFNPNSVHNFIKIFKESLGFAKVYESDIVEAENHPIEEGKMIPASDKIPVNEALPIQAPRSNVVLGEREFANFPISPEHNARILISGEFPVPEEAMKKLIKFLALYCNLDLSKIDDEKKLLS